jgi:hypothetical protein
MDEPSRHQGSVASSAARFIRIFPPAARARSSMGNPKSEWGSSYRLIAAEKWKSKSAAMGCEVTRALVQYARPASGMKVRGGASGAGEPAGFQSRFAGGNGSRSQQRASACAGYVPFRRSRRCHRALAFRRAAFSRGGDETPAMDLVRNGGGTLGIAQALSAPFRPLLQRIPSNRRVEIDAQVHPARRRDENGGRLKFEAVVRFASGREPGSSGKETGKECFIGVRGGCRS